MIFYPDGYGTAKLSLEQMKLKHGVKMHPEFAKRFFAYVEHKGGALGVGGGWRSISNVSAASAVGKSFHQDQKFASGFVGYAAVDLVHVVPGNKHRSPTWAETEDAPLYGLHTFIKVPNEPWHIQCIEMRGWQTWVNAGRPDPQPFTLPGTPAPPPPAVDEVDMILIKYDRGGGDWTGLSYTGTQLAHVTTSDAWSIPTSVGAPVVNVNDAQLDALIKSAQTTNACPPEWVGTSRGAAWTAQRG